MMTPTGLSVLVNACLFLLMARAFTASSAPAQKYMAVELQAPAQAIVHRITKPQIKQVVLPIPPQPVRQSRPAPTKPSQAVLTSKQEMRPIPRPAQDTRATAPTLRLPQPNAGGSHGGGQRAWGLPGNGEVGGSTSAGPGAYVGPGEDAGGGGNGTGSVASSGHGNGEARVSPPAQVHENHPPAPEPPKPAPKIESRSAQLSRQVKPTYPSDAREEGVEGAVVLNIEISADGKVTSAKVANGSGDRRLDHAAVEAVRKWVYSPGLEDGVPVASSMRVRVEFRLQ